MVRPPKRRVRGPALGELLSTGYEGDVWSALARYLLAVWGDNITFSNRESGTEGSTGETPPEIGGMVTT